MIEKGEKLAFLGSSVRSRLLICLTLAWLVAFDTGCRPRATAPSDPQVLHVYPGGDIQATLDQAAQQSIRNVVVHAGTYAPPEHRQALVWFNQRHDGIHLHAQGSVVLTAANEQIANPKRSSFPAVVNHVVYFGDGVSRRTKLSGFTITGANNYVTTKQGPAIEPDSDHPKLGKTAFFYTDGGAIKIFGRSYPTLENLQIVDNYASPSSGGISIEHRGFIEERVEIRSCVFRNNRSPLTGAAIALLDHEYGSAALIENCLFDGNLSNCKLDRRSEQLGSWNASSGHGAVTVFAFSQAEVRNCTFIGNRNGVDDLSQTSTFGNCIFWNNSAPGGWAEGDRYDIQVARREAVEDCYLGSNSLRFDPRKNLLQAPDPEFDNRFVPRSSVYAAAGFRPAGEPGRAATAATGNVKSENFRGMETLQIGVDGKEFGWNIRYPGADQELDTDDDVITRRHIHVPTGTKVRLIVGSQDYLYQLALPEQAVKEVAIPGRWQRCSFTVEKPGIYPLVGDQFCGYTHPDLIGKLIAMELEEFQKWLNHQQSP